jgi:serine/threonine protein kinase
MSAKMVFISHSTKDDPVVADLRRTLELLSIEVWADSRRLGGGGMGVVYSAEDIRLGRLLGLKFLPKELAQHPGALEGFQRQVRSASAFSEVREPNRNDIA